MKQDAATGNTVGIKTKKAALSDNRNGFLKNH
jgi:hypothetical protein